VPGDGRYVGRLNVADPAVLLSGRPADDPLESIMYMTSVGVPSTVYETVRSLRQARAARLGALQRKLPPIHMLLLWILAAIELASFPLLGAGTQSIGGYNILTRGVYFSYDVWLFLPCGLWENCGVRRVEPTMSIPSFRSW
jgi:hypothetical protein